jgi:hypothetical protein
LGVFDGHPDSDLADFEEFLDTGDAGLLIGFLFIDDCSAFWLWLVFSRFASSAKLSFELSDFLFFCFNLEALIFNPLLKNWYLS